MGKKNCWEVKKCGREKGGVHESDHGVCPAYSDTSCNGINDGWNGGRICWAVAGTLCGGKVQGDFAEKRISCMSCEFYDMVRQEQGRENFMILKPGQEFKKSER